MKHTIATGSTGLFASIGSAIVSCLPFVETALRITSLGIGITVGVLSIISLRRNLKNKNKDSKHETDK